MSIKSKKLKAEIRNRRASNARILKSYKELEKYGPNGIGAVADSQKTVITHWDQAPLRKTKW